MGAVLAKFRREKTTAAVLEGLEEQIQQIEKYSQNTQEQKKRFVGNFLAISIGVYVLAFLIFYFVYFPPTWSQRIIYSVPLLLFPFVIILLRKLFTWYFQRKLNKNSSKLAALRADKKKILEQVMDKETYKVAVALLARFGDKSSISGVKPLYAMTPRASSNILNQSQRTNNNMLNTSLSQTQPRTLNSSLSATPRAVSGSGTQLHSSSALTSLRSGSSSIAGQELRRRTPFPIINAQEKGVFERIVDALIGDGPNDRFAMICKECHGHNGMAPKEEFDYATFRCAFCNVINPSRKERPVAPRLPIQSPRLDLEKDSDSSSTSDSENERIQKTLPKLGMTATSPIDSSISEFRSPATRLENAARTEATAMKSSSASSINSQQSEAADVQHSPTSGKLQAFEEQLQAELKSELQQMDIEEAID